MTDKAATVTRQFMDTAERMPTLFSLDDEYLAILALMDEGDADEQLETRLALVETSLAQKVENYVSLIRTVEHLADARKAEADRLAARAKTATRFADALRGRLLVHLQTTGQRHIETARFTLSVRENPGRVEVLEQQMVPAEFIKVVVTETPDKRAIAAHIKSTGEIPPGIEFVKSDRLEFR